jgi:putative FmdB family regulatory protein
VCLLCNTLKLTEAFMPTYDYECSACKHKWEEFHSITAAPTKKCPECKKNKAVRQIGTGAGIIFKGSGFYQTDYRSSSYNKAAEADKSSQSESPKTDSTPKPDAPKSDKKS